MVVDRRVQEEVANGKSRLGWAVRRNLRNCHEEGATILVRARRCRGPRHRFDEVLHVKPTLVYPQAVTATIIAMPPKQNGEAEHDLQDADFAKVRDPSTMLTFAWLRRLSRHSRNSIAANKLPPPSRTTLLLLKQRLTSFSLLPANKTSPGLPPHNPMAQLITQPLNLAHDLIVCSNPPQASYRPQATNDRI